MNLITEYNTMKNSKLLIVLLSVLLVSLSGCGFEEGDYGDRRQIELTLKDGGNVTLVCPEFDRQPLGGHGRECYIRKAN